jgi:putative PIN family toxin of toxin-antitoxin system
VWTTGRVVPLVSRATTEELLRVLSYPKFRSSTSDVEELLGDCLPWAEHVEVGRQSTDLVCADVHDQMFLDLAVAAAASGLVTGDAHLLALRTDAPFEIVERSDLVRRVQLADRDPA